MARISEIKQIKICRTICGNPFYIKWKNQFGGWEHWLFDRKIGIGEQISHGPEYTPNYSDIATTKSVSRITHTETIPFVRVTAPLLEDEDIQFLRTILRDGAKVYYMVDQTRNIWQQIRPRPGTFSLYESEKIQALQDLELTFDLQPIFTQFN